MMLPLLVSLLILVQTMPRPEQVNPLQVRIVDGGDSGSGTLVRSDQIQDGRHTVALSDCAWCQGWDGAPAATKVVCVVVFAKATSPGSPMQGFRLSVCYSQVGQAALLMDPAWAAWYAMQ